MKLPALTNRTIIIGVTLVCLFGLVAYYMMVVVTDKEKRFHDKKFRIIAQIGENIKAKHSQIEKVIQSIGKNPKALNSVGLCADKKNFNNLKFYFGDGFNNSGHQGNPGTLEYDVRAFLNPLLRPSDFKHLAVFEETNGKCHEVFATFKPVTQLAFANALLGWQSLSLNHRSNQEIDGAMHLAYAQRVLVGSRSWIICGFVKQSDFRQATRSLSTWNLIHLGLITLFLTLGMPLIKLWIMNSHEWLPVRTVWFTGLAFIVGTAVVVLLILSIFSGLQETNQTDKTLETLANRISKSFDAELKTIRKGLESVKPYAYAAEKKKTSNGKYFRDNFHNNYDSILEKPLRKALGENVVAAFNEIMWIDSSMYATQTLASYPIDTSIKFPDLKDRSYANNPRANWRAGERPKIYIQSMVSLITNQPEVGIGLHTDSLRKNAPVIAFAGKLNSVMDVLLPYGFGFCIVDEKGLVWFHSNSNFNLRENIFEETGNRLIKAAVRTSTPFWETVTYHDKICKTFGKPLGDTGLYLITFSPAEYQTAVLIQTVSSTAMFMLLLFLVQGLQLILLYGLSRRNSRLEMKRFFLHWMRPRDGSSYKMMYRQMAVAFTLIVGMQIICIWKFQKDPSLWVCFVLTPPILAAWVYYRIKSAQQWLYSKTHIWFGILTGFMVCVMAIVAIQLLLHGQHWLMLSKYMVGVVLILLSSVLVQSAMPKWIGYQVFLTTWLFAVSVLPVYFFFKGSYASHNLIWQRHKMIEVAKQQDARIAGYMPKIDSKAATQRNTSLAQGSSKIWRMREDKIRSALTDGQYLSKGHMHSKPALMKDEPIDTLLSYLFIPYDSLFFKARNGFWKQPYDARITFYNTDSTQEMHFAGLVPMRYQSKNDVYHFILINNRFGSLGAFFIGLCIACTYLLWLTLHFALKRIYGFGWKYGKTLQIEPHQMPHVLAHTHKVFLVGLPGSGISRHLDFVPITGNSIRNYAFGKTISALDSIEEIIVIENFDYALNNYVLLDNKMEFLQSVQSANQNVIITSTVSPSVILDVCENRLRELEKNKESRELRIEIQQAKSKIRIWKTLLSTYSVFYVPLKRGDDLPTNENESWLNLELNIGHYMPTFIPMLRPMVLPLANENEEKTLLVESHCHGYYQGIWNCLTRDEKFLLYDLAKDRYMNYKNKKHIRHLMSLGLIWKNDTLRLMNSSFGQFILTTISVDEETSMEKMSRERGAWSNAQWVLILVALGIAGFLAFTQEVLFDKLSSILTALVGVAALIFRFSGFLGGSEKLKE